MSDFKSLVVASLMLLGFQVKSQETISIMYYNILNYPSTNPDRIAYLKTICQDVLPDILVVNELTSSTGANNILSLALNQDGITYYAKANYVAGPDDDNMLYYNSNKLGLISQSEIPTSLRDINEYILYYKNPSLTAESDTAYLYVYGAHLKAGSSDQDKADRASEVNTLKNYLGNRSFAENTIVGGDFNIYGSSELAYTYLTFGNQANLHDVVGPGEYHNNVVFDDHFTQSTRALGEQFDGGSDGGMDDRFDFILFSDDLLNGQNGVRYKTNSYRPIGQDGGRLNKSLIDPVNNSESAAVISALYYMSDHIPIYMEVEVGGDIGVHEIDLDAHLKVYPIPTANQLTVIWSLQEEYHLELVELNGKIVANKFAETGKVSIVDCTDLNPGAYILKITSESGVVFRKVIIE